MVTMIVDGVPFTREMFVGGVSAADLERIRVERKDAKEKKEKEKTTEHTDTTQSAAVDVDAYRQTPADPNMVAQLVSDKLGASIKALDEKMSQSSVKLNQIADGTSGIVDIIDKAIDRKMASIQAAIVGALNNYLRNNVISSEIDGPPSQYTVQQDQEPHRSSLNQDAAEIISGVVGDLTAAGHTKVNDHFFSCPNMMGNC